MPFFNRQNNEDLILAIQTAEMFQVEIVDFENETHFFEVEAENEAEANSKASQLFGGDIYMMNIYEY